MVGGWETTVSNFFSSPEKLKRVLSCDIMLSTVEEMFALRKIDGANVINSIIHYLSCILICS